MSLRRLPDGGGYELWFNRDEKHARAPEAPPRRGQTPRGVRYAMPVDGERGGTWLLLNEHGLTACVLNDYESGAESKPETRESRGRLPLECAECADIGQAREVLHTLDLARFAPFRLVVVDRSGAGRVVHWDGRERQEALAPDFLTSSSWMPARVRAAREARRAVLGDAGGWTAEMQEALHWEHDRAAGAESVLMRREDARTRSVCRVRVNAERERSLRYVAVDWAAANARGATVEARP